MNNQKRLGDLARRLEGISQRSDLAHSLTKQSSTLAAQIDHHELVIPVVGAFSAGKSSLLNRLMGREVLPTDITPETSLATELHHGLKEQIEAIRKDGSFETFGFHQFDDLKSRAKEFSFVRAYIPNDALKALEPLILVDMPGFESPLDAHNQAILTYLSRGSHYVVLSSVEEGTVQEPIIRQLIEMKTLHRGFTFLVSKADLKPSKDVDLIVTEVETVLRDRLGLKMRVTAVGLDQNDDIPSLLRSIDPERLFLDVFSEPVRAVANSVLSAINVKIAAATQSEGENQRLVEELRKSLAKMTEKCVRMKGEVEQKYSRVMIDDLVMAVGSALDSAMEELVTVAAGGQGDALSQRLSEIVRHALTLAMGEKLENLNSRIVGDFTTELRGLDDAMKGETIDSEFVKSLGGKIQVAFRGILGSTTPGPSATSGQAAKAVFKTVVGALAIMTNILAPLVELVIFFLPEILGPLFSGIQKQKQANLVREKMIAEVFPSIKAKLRQELPSLLSNQVRTMIEEIDAQFQQSIVQQEESLKKAMADAAVGGQELQAKCALWMECRTEVQGILAEFPGAKE